MAKLDCPECGGNLFLMARKKDKPSWRCCTRPQHVFVMEADRALIPVSVNGAATSDEHRARLAEELHRGCSDEADLLRRLGDL